VPKPFPDALILQQTSQTAEITWPTMGWRGATSHGDRLRRRSGAGLSDTRLGDIAVAHTAQDGIVGGFTLAPSRQE